MSEATNKHPIAQLVNSQVVVDTDSAYIYIGHLDAVHPDCLVLSNVDVHNTADTRTSKEHYTHETKQLGIRHNRQRTIIRLDRVVSLCRLDDVLTF